MNAVLQTLRYTLLASFLISFLGLSACSKPALQFSDGTNKALDAYAGQWLLINYWAIWCKPCVEEIPELNALDKDARVTVLAYNFDGKQNEALAEQAEKLQLELAMLSVAPEMLFKQEAPNGLPATLIVNPEGEFHSWLMGPQTKAGILKRLGLL
jgi:thiol-disulfide isomerase/thioredoxin